MQYRCACGAPGDPTRPHDYKCRECQRLEALTLVNVLKARRQLETDLLSRIAAFHNETALAVDGVELVYEDRVGQGRVLKGVRVEVKL